MKTAYIAGKITGNKDFEREFTEAENKLKAEGFAVMNPAVLNPGFSQSEYLHVCMAMIDVCDAVYFLPTWIDSKGAHFEMGYAKAMKKEIKYL